MRIQLSGLLLIGLLASGCSSEQAADQASSQGPAPAGANAIAGRSAPASLAALPDRGELLAFNAARQPEVSGAYTFHPVQISEAHALNAIASGELRFTGPDGKPVVVAYQRHEESADGNWSWIGRDAKGQPTVLTFGPDAVFGSISQDGEQYRVTTRDGAAWLVATDRTRLAAGHPAHDGVADVLLPPRTMQGQIATQATAVEIPDSSRTVTPKALALVDLVLGYSNSLSTRYGSELAAVTRLNNLVTMSNVAYEQSGLSMRLRLVNSLAVEFPDTGSNSDVLYKLTGVNPANGQLATPDPAFEALRKARDTYGADLVSFVRPFVSPEHQGCGVAWLLGANGQPITAADAPYGYSVVSDGTSVDPADGNTYMCSDYSLAHELGHNMGQVHAQADASTPGAHPYSYGYRETTGNGFFTIMSYPLANASQVEIPYFANPSIRYDGRPTGVANSADNARSMNQTMPKVAAFRATVVKLPYVQTNDINGDGKAEVFWRNSVDGRTVIWWAGEFAGHTFPGVVANQAWNIVGSGDFAGDGKADLFWRNGQTGENMLWPDGDASKAKTLTTVGTAWKVVATGDFNGDGKHDIFWRNTADGRNIVWWAGEYTGHTTAETVNTNWQVVGAGDLNGDGQSDVIWRNTADGRNIIWWSANYAGFTNMESVVDQAWEIALIGDFDGDGRDDLFWHNKANGQAMMWPRGSSVSRLERQTMPLAWQPVAAGDYNGDGTIDVLYRNGVTGENQIWDSSRYVWRRPAETVGTAWRVQP